MVLDLDKKPSFLNWKLANAQKAFLDGHKSLNTKFLANGGSLNIEPDRVIVSMKKKRHLPLVLQMLKQVGSTKIPWLGKRRLEFEAWSAS